MLKLARQGRQVYNTTFWRLDLEASNDSQGAYYYTCSETMGHE